MNIILTKLPAPPGQGDRFYSGRAVVSWDFLESLLSLVSNGRIIILTPESRLQQYQDHLTNYLESSCLELLNVLEIKRSIDQAELTAILTLEPGLREGLHLRYLCNRPYWPVIGLTHDLSSLEVYNELLLSQIGFPQKHDAIVCTSQSAKKVLTKLLSRSSHATNTPNRIETPVIPLGVNLSHFQHLQAHYEANNIVTNFRPVTFLYLGRISYAMKADLFPVLSAFKSVHKQSNVKLIIAGALIEPDEITLNRINQFIIENNLENSVHVYININLETKQKLLAETDIFISPSDSFQESFGLAIIEAMAIGLPVIASDWNGYRDIVENDKTGILVQTIMPEIGLEEISNNMLYENRWWWYGQFSQSVFIDHKQLEHAMVRLVNNAQLRRDMGRAGAEKVKHIYNWPVIIQQWLDLVSTLINNASRTFEQSKSSPYSYNHTDVFYHHSTKHFNRASVVRTTGRNHKSNFELINAPPFYNLKMLAFLIDSIQKPIAINAISFDESLLIRYLSYLLKHNYAEFVDEQ